jgi:hypothetical protein
VKLTGYNKHNTHEREREYTSQHFYLTSFFLSQVSHKVTNEKHEHTTQREKNEDEKRNNQNDINDQKKRTIDIDTDR